MTDTKTNTPTTKSPRKMARELKADVQAEQLTGQDAPVDTLAAPTPADAATVPTKAPTKASLVLDMLRRPEGASIDQLVAATGWLPHTTRAALTGLKKKGHVITSEKCDGARVYNVTDSGAQ